MITIDLTNTSGNVFCVAEKIKSDLEQFTGSKLQPKFYNYMECGDYTHAIMHFLKYCNIKLKGRIYTFKDAVNCAEALAKN